MKSSKWAALGLSAIMATTGVVAVGAVASPASAAPAPKLTGLKVTGWGMKSITVAWNNSGRGSYQQVQYCISGNASSCKEIKTGAGASNYTVTNLEHGKTYRFQVRAVNADGGVWSDPVYWKAGLPGKTGTPQASAGNASAQVTWSTSRNLAALNGYTLYTYNSAGTSIKSQNVAWKDASVTSATVTGLSNGTGYKFKVIAKNEYGSNPATDFSNTVTPSAVPGAPTNLKVTPGSKQVVVSWSPGNNGGSAITGYNVQVKRGTGNWQEFVATTGTTATVGNLKNGEPVMIQVQAKNKNGAGFFAISDEVTPIGTPEQVTKPHAAGDVASAKVFWVAPDNGGTPITSYDVQYAYEEPGQTDHSWTELGNFSGSADSATATNLTTGKKVVFRVRANNAQGNGAYSDTSDPVEVMKEKAPAPKNVSAKAALNAITISWTPGAPNGTVIKGYEAQVSCDGGKNWTTKAVGPNVHEATFTGLPGGVACKTRVRAIAEDGGPASDWIQLGKDVAPIAQAAPGAVSVSDLAWTSNSSMRVNIKAPAKATKLQVRTAAGASTNYGAWKNLSKATTRLAYSPGSTGISIQVRACTETCSPAATIVAKLSARNTKTAKQMPQVAGTITNGARQTIFFRNSKKVQWRVQPSGSRTSGWKTSAPKTYTVTRPGMSFNMRTTNKKVTAKIKVLTNGTYQGSVKGKK